MSIKIEVGDKYVLKGYGEVDVISVRRIPTAIYCQGDPEDPTRFRSVGEEYEVVFVANERVPPYGTRQESLKAEEFYAKVEGSLGKTDKKLEGGDD